MHYKTQSYLTIALLLGLMTIIAISVNNLEGGITGAVIQPICDCTENSECNDNNPCTEDFCLYQDTCEAALCVNKQIENCG